MKKIINTKFIKYPLFLVIITSGLFFNSCNNELDINVDPNFPREVTGKFLLTVPEVNLAYTLGGDATRISASVVQYYAGHRGQPLQYAQYNITSSAADGLWSNLYDAANDLKSLEKNSNSAGNKVYEGVAQLLQAYTFSVTTDLFGDIPYSNALGGVTNITPSYDKQEIIYSQLITLVESGIANVRTNAGTFKPTTDDVIYGGNIVKWEKFGNSLKLRLLNHLVKRNPTLASAFLATNPLLISLNTDNAKLIFGTTPANANPIYQFDVLSGRKDNAVSSTFVNKLKALSDPRIPLYFKPVVNGSLAGQYLGNNPGNDNDDAGESQYSRVGSAYASIGSPVILMSAAEVNFIKSEIYFRDSNLPNSKTAYEAAITSDFTDLTLTAAAATTYFTTPLVAYDNTLSRIMEQKWITMYQSAFESWVDYRRTGLPVLTPALNNFTTNVVPRRLSYPQIEINVNGAALSAGPGIPIPYESLKTKVWWDN